MYAATSATPASSASGRRADGRARRDPPLALAPRASLRSLPAVPGPRRRVAGRPPAGAGPSASRARRPRARRRASAGGRAPLAFAGTGPTQASTGTSRWATRSARTTPSWPSAPGVSSCRTTIAPARSASASRSSRYARSGRSIGPIDLDHVHPRDRLRRGLSGQRAGDPDREDRSDERATNRLGETHGGRIVSSRAERRSGVSWWDPMSVDTGRRPAGPPPPGGRPGPRPPRDPRSVRDRVSFKPIAALLLIPVILATSILTAAVLAPPFAAAGFGRERDPLAPRRAGVGLHADPDASPSAPRSTRRTAPSSPRSTSTTARSCRSTRSPRTPRAGGARDRGLRLLRSTARWTGPP